MASKGLRVYAVPIFAFWIFSGVMSFSEHRAPTFTIEPPNKVMFLNSSGESVHCAALGNPRPSISWVLADGTAVQDLPGLRLALANGTLLFLPFMAESYRQDIHASTYRCIASNLVGKISSRDIRIRAGMSYI
ncbi:Down syndrome cell adhesion molecule-like [Argiope bruennichi]|uniref:Down syndrome cell adhesion molecule-like n=1 Tax=Argiope bruennichi TaxID=94029 RepID=A0A8T0G289_ARGBR|nr:Down syndrome cell adhesion molecule-like [Argiope bruennichi]